MKTIYRISILLLCISSSLPLFAQKYGGREIATLFELHSANIEFGTYHPSFNGLTRVLQPQFGVTEDFGTNVAIGTNFKIRIPYEMQFRIGFNYWQDTFDNASPSAFEMKTAFYRYSFALFYAPVATQIRVGQGVRKIETYAGLDIQLMKIKSKVDYSNSNMKSDGNDILFSTVVGGEYTFFDDMLNVGLELRYNLGNYEQDDMQDIPNKVKMNGFEWRLLVGYRFKKGISLLGKIFDS